MTTLGLNYRMSDINAALGRVQLRHLPELIRKRQANYSQLKARLAGENGLSLIEDHGPKVGHSPYCLSVVLQGRVAARRNDLLLRLKVRGIGTSVYYPHPLPRLTYYRKKYGTSIGEVPSATDISDHSVALPVGPHLTEEDVDRVAQQFREILMEVDK